MENQSYTIKDVEPIAASGAQNVLDALDAGAFKEVEVAFSVLSAGGAGTLKLQHAAVNKEEAYMDLSGISVSLTSTGNTYHHVANFLRFLRWKAEGVSGAPAIAGIQVITKN